MSSLHPENISGADGGAQPKSRILAGVLLGLTGMSVFSCGDAVTKYLGHAGVPPIQIMALSGVFSVVAIVFYAVLRGRARYLLPRRWSVEIPRAISFLGLSFLSIVTFTRFPMTTVYAAIYLSPSLVALIGLFFLKERLNLPQAGLILLGFAGALLAINPVGLFALQACAFDLGTLIAYPVFFAINMILTRFVRETESSESIVCFPLLVQTIIILPYALSNWQVIGIGEWAGMIAKGVATGGGFFLVSLALSRAPAAVVSPTQYFQIILGSIFGLVLWNVGLYSLQVFGIMIILMSGFWGARRAFIASR
ncbi:MAG: DMT family transporter [Desulfovibrionaceae bacterium]|nr:DMT family transporter [Desulfovibrionaceae bacterium]MBF0513227.1 DMT family transporter [Desulfovibrionaceae bacterium]